MMYFSKLQLQRDHLDAQALAARVCRDSYRPHQVLWRLFGTPDQNRRDFLFRQEEHGSWPTFFVVSSRPPADVDPLWNLQTKDYAPKIRKGQRLAFSLRANPVVTRKTSSGKQVRHDVLMDIKKRTGYHDLPVTKRPPNSVLAQQAGTDWLERRCTTNGFRLDRNQVRVDSYRRHRAYKASAGRSIEYSTLDFDGILEVADPDLFGKALFQGIGPAKGFGCGLLLVRRL